MAQLSDDCFAFGGALLTLADAQARIAATHDVRAGVETVALGAAVGRVLAADVMAPVDLPPSDNAAVDGFAVHFDDLLTDRPTVLPIEGRRPAGACPGGTLSRGRALRIFTGAVMPEGADTVMMQEDCVFTAAEVTVRPGIRRGANLRVAGEDSGRGKLALAGGRRLGGRILGCWRRWGSIGWRCGGGFA